MYPAQKDRFLPALHPQYPTPSPLFATPVLSQFLQVTSTESITYRKLIVIFRHEKAPVFSLFSGIFERFLAKNSPKTGLLRG